MEFSLVTQKLKVLVWDLNIPKMGRFYRDSFVIRAYLTIRIVKGEIIWKVCVGGVFNH
jgi:hypothetical protein